MTVSDLALLTTRQLELPADKVAQHWEDVVVLGTEVHHAGDRVVASDIERRATPS